MPKSAPPPKARRALSQSKRAVLKPVKSVETASGNTDRKMAGPTLTDIQSLMSQVLMRPLTSSENTQRLWTDGTPTARVVERIIKPNDRLSSFERLQIYNQQYWWRLLGCFGDDFRGVRGVLGEKKFDRLAVRYLETCGSTSWSLRNLGLKLPAFIADHPDLTAPHTALALDMARMECARITAFDGPAKPVIDSQKLASVSPDRLRLGLQPYLSLLKLAYPVDFLLKRQRDTSVETGSASNAVSGSVHRRTRMIRSKPSPAPIYLAVHRVDFTVYYKRLAPEGFALLNSLRGGATLADACESAFANSTAAPEQNAEQLREWFAVWMELGWLTR